MKKKINCLEGPKMINTPNYIEPNLLQNLELANLNTTAKCANNAIILN